MKRVRRGKRRATPAPASWRREGGKCSRWVEGVMAVLENVLDYTACIFLEAITRMSKSRRRAGESSRVATSAEAENERSSRQPRQRPPPPRSHRKPHHAYSFSAYPP